MVSAVRDIHIPREQPDAEEDYDYEKLKDHANDFAQTSHGDVSTTQKKS